MNGRARLTDFMPVHHDEEAPIEPYKVGESHQIMRIIECIEGSIDMTLQCHPRFEYGSVVPHLHMERPNIGFAHGGSGAISLYCSVPLRMVEGGFVADGILRKGQKAFAIVTYESRFSYDAGSLNSAEIENSLAEAIQYWQDWSGICTYDGPYKDNVLRSALALKALTYAPSGGMVAAPTTSIPELIGGERNWDYRYTWIRDASFAIYGTAHPGLPERSPGVQELDTVGNRRSCARSAHHVWTGGRAPVDRGHTARTLRLSGLRACTNRQRRIQPVSA